MKALRIALIAVVLFSIFFLLNHFQNQKQAYISITFDDGYVSQYEASKTLASYGWRGTFYIPAGMVGGQFEGRQLMNWYQLKALQDNGHEIGCHTLNHTRASSTSEINYDVESFDCKKVLLDRSISVENFAYPYGDDLYKQAGKNFVTARGTEWCINNITDTELCGIALVNSYDNENILQPFLSDLKKNGGWLVIVIHDVSENPRPDVDLTKEQFASILEQIKSSGIKVKTVAEVVDGKA
ncbi:MAG: polysaccharide deacetylase family protein [archaeon]